MNNSKFLTITFILSLLIAFLLGILMGGMLPVSVNDDPVSTEAPTDAVSAPPSEVPSAEPSEEPAATPTPSTPELIEPSAPAGEPSDVPVSEAPKAECRVDLEALKATMDARLSTYVSDWVVLVEDLGSGEQIVSSTGSLTGDSPMTAASIVKLFIAGAVYDAAQKSGEKLDEATMLAMESMISISDNTTANDLIRRLGDGDVDAGMKVVNDFIESIGCTASKMNRLFMGSGEENLVSAADSAAVLRMIYSGTFVSKQASDDILEMLKNQDRTGKIPAGLAGFSGVSCANKTGELYLPEHENTQHDIAIVYTPNGDYLLCILATRISNQDSAIATHQWISQLVCTQYDQIAPEAETAVD